MILHQMVVPLVIAVSFLMLIIRLIQKGRLDVAYCWLWLTIGFIMIPVVVMPSFLVFLTHLIGAVTPTNTLFFLGLIVVLLMCLQFSLVITAHKRKIKKITQQLALFENKLSNINDNITK